VKDAVDPAKTPSRRTGAVAMLCGLRRGTGSGAFSGRRPVVLGLALTALAVFLFGTAFASAAEPIHPLVGPFGAAAQPSFGQPAGMAVDPASGDVYVIDFSDQTLHRYKPNGEPEPFSALGGNVIDGKSGADETPQGEILGTLGSPAEVQVTVAPPGAPFGFAGDIFVTDNANAEIDYFDREGNYLGQLHSSAESCGVSVAPDGDVLVGTFFEGISKFVPTGPGAFAAPTSIPSTSACNLAAGAGPTAGYVFATEFEGPVTKVDVEGAEEGQTDYTVSEGPNRTVSVDPATGHVFVAKSEEALEFDASGPTAATQVSHIALASAAEGVAAGEEQVYVARAGEAELEEYGPLSGGAKLPEATTEGATGISGSAATLHATVRPHGEATVVCRFEWGPAAGDYTGGSASCSPDPGTSRAEVAVSAEATGLTAHATYHYRVFIETAGGEAGGGDREFVASAPPVATTGAASEVEEEAATLNGTVDPQGGDSASCRFEYDTTEYKSPEEAPHGTPVACVADPAGDSGAVAVSARLTGLAHLQGYWFRVVESTDGGTTRGAGVRFATGTAPEVTTPTATSAATEAGGAVATLAATIDPNNSATTYHFEYGTGAGYGNSAPAPDGSAGAGDGFVPVSQPIAGLAKSTTYHYRLVAVNAFDEAATDDQTFTTPPAGSALPGGRVAELVSPGREKGPLATVGEAVNSITTPNTWFQVAPDGEGVSYETTPGLPGATAGGEVIYRARRGADGWSSEQVSAPSLRQSPGSKFNFPSAVRDLSENLDCGVLSSIQALTPDTPTRQVEEAGTAPESGTVPLTENLYRRGPDGEYTLLTPLTPTNISKEPGFEIVGESPDCSRIVFTSLNHYEGLSFEVGGEKRELYEWDESETPHLRHVGLAPGPAEEVQVPATPGGLNTHGGSNYWNAVSSDASRVIFSAASQIGADQGEQAIFVREDGQTATDVSQSETATVDTAAIYQDASTDGSRVFFTANAGLTSSSNAAGTDLYEYNFGRTAGERLRDLSVDSNPADGAGAAVVGLLDATPDGEYVYFGAQGQLLPGEGASYAQNRVAATYNIYRSHGDRLTWIAVGSLSDRQNLVENSVDAGSGGWTSRVTSSGGNLLFVSTADVTGYDSGGVPEAYLYSAGTGATRCVSCRPDGQASVGNSSTQPLLGGIGGPSTPAVGEVTHTPVNKLHPPLLLSADGSRVFFQMPDALAPGGVAGKHNIYEWQNGQVSLLATAPQAESEDGVKPVMYVPLEYVGASESGDDVFVATPQQMSPQDTDQRKDLYDLRVGGGFPTGSEPAAPCDALLEGACQASGQPPSPGTASATPGFTGPGNQPPPHHKKKHHKKKHHKKKHHKKKHHKKKHHQHAKARPEGSDRRAAK
jgi:hypothetical protein